VSWLDRALKALGLNPVRLRWKIHRLRERSRRKAREVENRSRALRYGHQVCPQCGLTADREERQCPRCGARLHGPWARRLSVLWRTLVPVGSQSGTTVLVGLIVLLYAATLTQLETSTNILSTLGRGVPHRVMDRFGAWTVERVLAGEVWRLVTSCLLHFGLLHLIFNALWLVQLGPLLEQILGRSRFVALTLASGVGGMGLSLVYRAATGTPAIGAGASGIIFGLIGAALVRGYLRKTTHSELLRGGVGKWALYAIIFSLLPGVDLVAHLGGGVVGAGLALVLSTESSPGRRVWWAVEVACLVLVVGCFVAQLSRILRG
jgi:membrane associated rhomboid family serine protease